MLSLWYRFYLLCYIIKQKQLCTRGWLISIFSLWRPFERYIIRFHQINIIVFTDLHFSVQGDSLARGPKLLSIKNDVIDVERGPFSASIMRRSCFASFPVCVYKFSSHYLNNIIFYRQYFGASSERIILYFYGPVMETLSSFNDQHLVTVGNS